MFEPQNALEQALVAAATDPAARPRFYRELIAAPLLVIREGDGADPSQLRVRHIEDEGRSWLPVFSSLPRLQAFVQEKVTYLTMSARDLLEITRGASLLLNPGSDYGKRLLPEEIASLLDGTMWRPSESHTFSRETRVLLGQPARSPDELIAVLQRVFETHKSVEAAYLAHFHNPEAGERPHTLIAIEATEDWDRIVAEAGMAANGVTVPDPPVDFTQLPNPGFDSYFRSVKPFYRRKRFGLF